MAVTWFFQAHVCEGARCREGNTSLAEMWDANGAIRGPREHISAIFHQKAFL